MDILEPSSDVPEPPVDESHEPRRSRRGKIPRRFHVIGGGDVAMVAASLDEVEPMTYKQALSLPNANKWNAAMQEELESMWTNQVWDLVDLPDGRKTIGN